MTSESSASPARKRLLDRVAAAWQSADIEDDPEAYDDREGRTG